MKPHLIISVALLALVLSGCGRTPQRASQLSFYHVAEKPSNSTRPAVINGQTIYLIEPPAITSPMVEDSYSLLDNHGRPEILIRFAEPTTSDFTAVSQAAIGKRLALVVSGEVIAAPVLRESISNGSILVTGLFSETKAMEITDSILGLHQPTGETQTRK